MYGLKRKRLYYKKFFKFTPASASDSLGSNKFRKFSFRTYQPESLDKQK